MIIQDAIEKLKQGETIRRKAWDTYVYIFLDTYGNVVIQDELDTDYDTFYTKTYDFSFTLEDIEANDWEIYLD